MQNTTQNGEIRGFAGYDVPEEDLLRACVHCGMCLSSCPTYRITGQEVSSPRGRLWLMSAVGEGRMSIDDPVFKDQMYECLDCRACEAVCPSGVQYGILVESSRSQIEQHMERSVPERAVRKVMLDWLFSDVRRISLVARATGIYKRSGAQALARKSGVLDKLGMADAEKLAPAADGKRIVPGEESWSPEQLRLSADLFNGCMMGTVFPTTNRSAASVMAINGIAVDVPIQQGCCGALLVHSGMANEARDLARKNIDAFEATGSNPIVVTAAGCGSTLKEYGHLLKDDSAYADRAQAFSDRVKDFTEIMAENLVVEPGPLRRTVTYQEPCHLVHAQRISEEPRTLMRAIPGLELVEMRESSLCCGSAGIYNLLRPEMAKELGDRKAGHAAETAAQVVITANPGCAIQVTGALERNETPIPVTHIADLMAEAYANRVTKTSAD